MCQVSTVTQIAANRTFHNILACKSVQTNPGLGAPKKKSRV
jgi:hypothetical protein